VSIISPVPQTTRNRVRGIYNDQQGQLVFVDTPGFHLSDKRINLHLKKLATKTLSEVEVVLYLIDVTRPPGEEEQALINLLRGFEDHLVVALNKIDISDTHVARVREELIATMNQPKIHLISALTGQGVETLLQDIWDRAPEGERMYPEDYYTDQSPDLYVDISDMEMKDRDRYLWVRGFIYVERESQKGIVVGKGGEKIKTILREAEQECNQLFPYEVKLDIRVKTRPKWRKDEGLLKKIIS
jgi:GTP-binding protein Era